MKQYCGAMKVSGRLLSVLLAAAVLVAMVVVAPFADKDASVYSADNLPAPVTQVSLPYSEPGGVELGEALWGDEDPAPVWTPTEAERVGGLSAVYGKAYQLALEAGKVYEIATKAIMEEDDWGNENVHYLDAWLLDEHGNIAEGNDRSWGMLPRVQTGEYEDGPLQYVFTPKTSGTYYILFGSGVIGDYEYYGWNNDINFPFEVKVSDTLGGFSGSVTEVGGGAASEVRVCFYKKDGANWQHDNERDAFTDDNGDYRIAGLPAGEYKVLFGHYGNIYYPQYYNEKTDRDARSPLDVADADSVTLVAGQLAGNNINASMEKGSQVTGRVLNAPYYGNYPDEAYIRVLLIRIKGANEPNQEEADVSVYWTRGAFDFGGVRHGRYIVQASYYDSKASTEKNLYYRAGTKGTAAESLATVIDITAKTVRDGINIDFAADPPRETAKSIAGAQITQIADKAWTGAQLKPVISVMLGGKALKSGTDYTVSYGANKAVGNGTVTITGKGSYTGSKTANFKIIPKKMSIKSVKPGKKSAKLAWKKASAAQKITGYEIRYKDKKSNKWKSKKVSAKSASVTIKGLKSKKAYQFQIRAYKTVNKAAYAAAWSATKTSKKIK